VKRLAAVVVNGLLLSSLMGCRGRTRPAQAEPLGDVFRRHAQEEGLSRVQTEGKRLFARYCATCHGDAGQGDGQNAYNLDPVPPDFQQSLKAHPSSYWRQIIEGGSGAVGRSSLCPPWGRTLSGDDVAALVAYLETLSRPPAPAPQGPAKAGGAQDP
jgi:mono/diheme cytochrome c family protein